MTTTNYVPAYVHHPAGIRATADDLHANLGTIADYLQAVGNGDRAPVMTTGELARRLDAVTAAVVAAERWVAELAAEVTA